MSQLLQGQGPRVVAAGECMLELARQGELWRLGAAGDTFNTALYLRRLGARVRYFTALGVDPFSEEMLLGWQREGLDVSLVLRDATHLPGLYAIRTDDRGERSFYYWRQQAAVRQLFGLPGIDAALQASAGCDLLYLSGITLSLFDARDRARWQALAAAVRQQGGKVAFDPNYRPRGWASASEALAAMESLAPLVDILLTSAEDHQLLCGSASGTAIASHWLALGVAEVVLKRGSEGAVAHAGGQVCEAGVPRVVAMVDSTGAGDAFNAAYLAARLSGGSLESALHAGNALAGAVVQVPGAILPVERMPELTKP